MVSLLTVPHDDERLLALVAAQEAEVMARYDEVDAGPGLGPASSCLLALDDDGGVLGCVGVSPLGDDGASGELKRLYVVPAARGRGSSRLLLAAAEDAAAGRGVVVLRLETGDRQPEALALYRRSGWHEIACYGYFAADPSTICFEKRLDARRR